jgi:large subunit ribosomal protein L18
MISSRQLFERRRARNRTALKRASSGQVRLSVHRSSKHIYAQIIDDRLGQTLAAASTLEADLKGAGGTSNSNAAAAVGKLVAERAKAKGVDSVVFDRGGFIYHGRVKALAEAAREAGLKF